jgi:NAD(P)H-flavin reductase
MNRPSPSVPAARTLRVRNYVRATPRSRILRLDLDGEAFHFTAGQAVMLGRHGQRHRKPYSIACAPEDASRDGTLEFLIGLDAHGQAGAHLDGIACGTPVDVEGPFGQFVFPDDLPERRVLLVAGGTGIAPLRAMLHHVLARRPDAAIALVYCARVSEELVYLGELRHLARHRLALTLTVTREPQQSGWAGDRGRLSRRHLAPHVVLGDTLCFLCGPPAFVNHVVPLLEELGLARRRIVKEDW